ncbi:MAG: PQQ-dependent sugar dehydrogenase [Candidatus Binatia bacterium]
MMKTIINLHRVPLASKKIIPIFASLLISIVIGSVGFSAKAHAQIVFNDPGFISETVATLPPYTPIGLTFAPDGRIFIWQKSGVVQIVKNSALLPTPFLDIQAHVNQCSDRGLLGLALDPDFVNNGFVYLLYTLETGGDPNDCGPKTSQLTRVSTDPANLDGALPGSEIVILGNLPSEAESHSIGTVRFAPDGKIFVGVGDAASPSFPDPQALRAQDLNSLAGKILRINPDGSAPANNPFYNGTNSNRSKVWAYGLRNPFRFGLHPISGEPYIADVGWNSKEEINRGRGKNFGWPCYEGAAPQPQYQAAFLQCRGLRQNAVTGPLHEYDSSMGKTAIGGTFYTSFLYPPQYHGNFFFADYVSKWIDRMVFDANQNVITISRFATGVEGPVSVEMGPDGMIYYVAIESGVVGRIRYVGPQQPPLVSANADTTSGYAPLVVNFSSAGSADPENGPLTLFWDFGDGTTSTAPNPQHSYVAGGVVSFTATLTVTDISGLSAADTVKITLGSLPPTATILTPTAGTVVVPGQTVNFEGSATDPDDGILLPATLSWTVLLQHNEHVHPHITETGSGGSFSATNHGVGNFGFKIILTTTDSSGLTSSQAIVLPMPPVGKPDVVAAYSFNEGVGNTINDASGNGNHGSIVSAAWVSGRYSDALDSDGSGDFIVVPDNATLDLGSTGTIEAWVRPASLNQWQGIIAKGNASLNYALGITDANLAVCSLGNIPTELAVLSTTPISSHAFQHLACSWDGTTLALYIDAILNNSVAQTRAPAANAAPLYIGQFAANTDRFDGVIDEVRIYNRALSQAEINFDMNTPIIDGDNQPPTSPTRLVARTASSSRINLSWAASTDNVAVSHYRVERCQGSGCNNFGHIATTATGTGFNDTGLAASTPFRYRVRASDASGNLSAYSNIFTARTGAPDRRPPSAPRRLIAAAVNAGQIDLGWIPSTDNIGVTEYQIERCLGVSCSTFAQIATVTVVNFSDVGLPSSTSVTYRVRAVDALGNRSLYSNRVTVTTP